MDADNTAVVQITEEAVNQIKKIQDQDPETAGKALRIYVQGSCCSSLQYGMGFDDQREDDTVMQQNGLSILVDSASLDYLNGATVDFASGPAGGEFKISNPNARHSCECDHDSEA